MNAEIPGFLIEMSLDLHTQKSSITEYPMYHVRCKDASGYKILFSSLTYDEAREYGRKEYVQDCGMHILITSIKESKEMVALIDWIKSLTNGENNGK